MMNAEPHAQPARVLMLGVGGETFAIDAVCVREIMDPAPVTSVPGARDFVRGVINVRGEIVPLADLRVPFGMREAEATRDTRYVVLEFKEETEDEPLLVAVIADKVHEVCEIATPDKAPPPRIGMSWPAELVETVVNWRDTFVIVPNMSAILN